MVDVALLIHQSMKEDTLSLSAMMVLVHGPAWDVGAMHNVGSKVYLSECYGEGKNSHSI